MASAEWYAYYLSNLNFKIHAEYCDKLHTWTISSFHGHSLQLQFLTNILQGLGDFYKKYGDFWGWGVGLFLLYPQKSP